MKYHENCTAKYGYPCVSMCNYNLRARRHDRRDKRTALLPQTCVYVLRGVCKKTTGQPTGCQSHLWAPPAAGWSARVPLSTPLHVKYSLSYRIVPPVLRNHHHHRSFLDVGRSPLCPDRRFRDVALLCSRTSSVDLSRTCQVLLQML